MADKDTDGGLLHRLYNAVTGAISSPSEPSKPAYTNNPVASGNPDEPYEGKGGAARKAALDKAIQDAGG